MKHKYKINIDQPVPSDDKIAQHKDFGRILADYRNLTEPIYNRPLYKNPKAFMGLALILTITFLVFWAVEKEEKDKANATVELPAEIKLAEENSFLKPPTKSLQIQPIRMKVNLEAPQKLQLPNGMTLSIPAQAFENTQGEPVTGEVEIAIRSVSQPAELIAMGIPMETDHDVIAPIAVVEVNASQGGKPLQLTSGKQIEFEQRVAPEFSHYGIVYNLDTENHLWKTVKNEAVGPAIKKEKAASIGEDGFGVVEYNSEGTLIPKKKPSNELSDEIKVMQFGTRQLGFVCLGESYSKQNPNYTIHLTDTLGNPLRLLTLYGLPKDLNMVQFFHPQTADFAFSIDPYVMSTFTLVGFLPDGRLAIAKDLGAFGRVNDTIPMKISAAPVKDLQDLTQLLSVEDGQ